GNLTDFPNSVVDASTTTNVDVSFAVIDSAGTTTVAATKPGSYDVLWFTFFVGNPNPGTVFCEPGVSGVMACGCGNPNAPGRGCANTGGAGATIGGAGDASLGADTLTLTGTSMFSGTSCIFLQGDAVVSAGAPFFSGVRCVGGSLIRLYVKTGLQP